MLQDFKSVYDYFRDTRCYKVNPLSANPQKWSNTLKQFVCNLPTNCLSLFDNFMNLALKVSTLVFASFDDYRQISLLVLSEFERINQLLFLLISSGITYGLLLIMSWGI